MYIYYIYIYIYIFFPIFSIFCIFLLLFANGPQAQYLNPGCLRCISGMNLSPANKILLITALIFQQKISANNGTLCKGDLIPNRLNNPPASSSIMSLYFLLLHTVDNSLIFPLLFFGNFRFLLFVFFGTTRNMTT